MKSSREAGHNVCIQRKVSSNNTVLRKIEISSSKESSNSAKKTHHMILIQFGDNLGFAKDKNYTCLLSF